MALKCNERLRRSTARQRGGESKHRKARDATEKHSAAKRRKGLAIPGDARRWRGDETLRELTRRLCFAQLCHATAKIGTDAQRSSKAVNGGGVARQSESPRSGGDEIGKRPARAPCGTREPGRGHAGWAEGPDLRKTTRRRGESTGGHRRGGGTRAAGGDGKASRPRKTHATSGAQGRSNRKSSVQRPRPTKELTTE